MSDPEPTPPAPAFFGKGPGRLPAMAPLTPHQAKVAEVAMEHPEWTNKQVADSLGLPAGNGARAIEVVLAKPQVQTYMATYLDAAGATMESAARVIAEAQNATEIKVFQDKGTIVESDPYVDHNTRLAAAKLNLTARGEIQDPGARVAPSLTVQLTDAQLERLRRGQALVEESAAAAPRSPVDPITPAAGPAAGDGPGEREALWP